MSRKQQWSILQVEKQAGKYTFRHGQLHFRAVPADGLDADSKVLVFRKGKLLDEGKVEELGGHDNGSQRFFGLDKIVPKTEKRRVALPMTAGFTDMIVCTWFEEGDVIRIQIPSSRFRAWMHLWREF